MEEIGKLVSTSTLAIAWSLQQEVGLQKFHLQVIKPLLFGYQSKLLLIYAFLHNSYT